jgi:hypothetical protein
VGGYGGEGPAVVLVVGEAVGGGGLRWFWILGR